MDILKGKSLSKEFLCQAQDKIEERPSSPNDCAICLEQLTDKSFTNSCLHMFCFHCLLAWSKVKPECPLCKQDFCSIIHNIRSMSDYDEYHVPPAEARLSMYLNQNPPSPDLYTHNHNTDFFSNNRQFFSYRTTLSSNGYTVPRVRASNLVIRPYVDTNLEIQTNFPIFSSSLQSQSRFTRQEIYLKELETIPPPAQGRFRACSPEFYRENEGQIHRLARWLQREFTALTQIGVQFDPHLLLSVIMDMLSVHRIDSTDFYYVVNRYLRPYTSRFIREFQNFAISPYEMDYYDRECVYIRQRNNFSSQFNVSMSGDDAEEVQVCNPSIQTLLPSDITRLFSVTDEQFGNVMCSQVIPNPTDFSARPWIDVNDLNTAHHQPQPSSSGVYSPARPTRYPFFSNSRQSFFGDQPSVSTNQQPAAVSHAVINISDSENDDCVIIEEERTQPETIILDDSDQETIISDQRLSLVGSLNSDGFQNRPSKAFDVSRAQTSLSQSYTTTLCMPSTSYHSVKGTANPSSSSLDLIKTYCKFEKESDVTVEYQSKASCSRSYDKRSPTHSSSVLSTDISSDETNHGAVTRSKKKRSRRFYKSKHRASFGEPTFLSGSSSTVSDKGDEDWEESRRKQRRKVKKNRSEKHEKKICQKSVNEILIQLSR